MQPQPYVQTASELAQRSPLIFVIILQAALLAALLGGLVWAIWKGVPRLLEWIEKRQLADHEHQKQLLEDLRSDANKDLDRSDKHISDVHSQIGARVEAVHADVRRIAAKIGATVLTLAVVSWLFVRMCSESNVFAASCEPPCPEGYKCKRAHPRTCTKDKEPEKTAAEKDKLARQPHSDVFQVGRLAHYAVGGCDARRCEMMN